ncbi:MAG: beta-lactamase family protein [Nocardiopsaceae bacterium]|nr:beta-lactamase family protein [Nocardiopsaceae bacterium]
MPAAYKTTSWAVGSRRRYRVSREGRHRFPYRAQRRGAPARLRTGSRPVRGSGRRRGPGPRRHPATQASKRERLARLGAGDQRVHRRRRRGPRAVPAARRCGRRDSWSPGDGGEAGDGGVATIRSAGWSCAGVTTRTGADCPRPLPAVRVAGRVLSVNELKIEAEPGEAGLDAGRLARIGRHFQRYVDDGRLAGWLLTVSRNGKLAHVASYGSRDAEAGLPVTHDTLWRVYSMTKPITSVAAMMLYEEGAFELTDPVSKFIPSFGDVRVYDGGSDLKPVTVPATEPVRIWHLLTHTSGLTYGFHRVHPVDALYRAAGYEWGTPRGATLEQGCNTWAGIPLLFQPGAEWNYSVATDVLGRVVEVASGQPLDSFFASRILGPLGMTDTSFHAVGDDASRLAVLYGVGRDGKASRLDSAGAAATRKPTMLCGGHGLLSTAADYNRFLSMLLDFPGSPAGSLDGTRLLSPRTVRYMGRNHLPGGADLVTFGRPLFAEAPLRGMGFGLGLAVMLDPSAAKYDCSPGELSWGGAASTAFWIDPVEGLTVTFFTQLLPSSTHPIRPQLRQLVYQALT